MERNGERTMFEEKEGEIQVKIKQSETKPGKDIKVNN